MQPETVSNSSVKSSDKPVDTEAQPGKDAKKPPPLIWERHFHRLINELSIVLTIVLVICALGILIPTGLTVGIGCGEIALVFSMETMAIIFYTLFFIWQRSRYRIVCRCCIKCQDDLQCCMRCEDAERVD